MIKATGTHWKTGDAGAAGTIVAAFDPALNGELDFLNILDPFKIRKCWILFINDK